MEITQEGPATFYLKHSGQSLEIKKITSFLLNYCKTNELSTARCCFHADTSSILMSMMIIVLDGFEYPPHKHIHKSESYTIMKGSCSLKYYDDLGMVIRSSIMQAGDMAINNTCHFHSLEPLSDMLVYVEHTCGPFKANGNEFLQK